MFVMNWTVTMEIKLLPCLCRLSVYRTSDRRCWFRILLHSLTNHLDLSFINKITTHLLWSWKISSTGNSCRIFLINERFRLIYWKFWFWIESIWNFGYNFLLEYWSDNNDVIVYTKTINTPVVPYIFDSYLTFTSSVFSVL